MGEGTECRAGPGPSGSRGPRRGARPPRGIGARRGRHPGQGPAQPGQGGRRRLRASGSSPSAGRAACSGARSGRRWGPPEPLPKSMLPDEIEKSLKRLGHGRRGPRGRWSASSPATCRRRRRRRSVASCLVAVTATSGHGRAPVRARRCGERLATQVFTPDAESFQDQLDQIRARRDAARIDAEAARAEADALAEADAEVRGSDLAGRRGRTRTDTPLTRHRLLRPARLPFRHSPAAESTAPRAADPRRDASTGRPTLHSPSDECDRSPPLRRARSCSRSRSPPSASTAPIRDAVRRLSPPHARRRVPARQGAAPHPRARPRPRRPSRRGRRAPRPATPTARPIVEQGILPLDQRGRRDRGAADEGKPVRLQGDRPGPARGQARRLRAASTSRPRSRTIDDAKVDKVVEELRDQNATLARGRGPRRRRTATRPSSASRARATACRSRAAPPSGCR